MLHHILLDRIEREATATDPASVDPPALAVFHAFETFDAGQMQFTQAKLGAIQGVLAEYHNASEWWETDQAPLESILHRVAQNIDRQEARLTAE